MPRNKFLLCSVLICVCLIMFYAGLKPKGFRLHNDVSWLAKENGISFGKFGIVYTRQQVAPAAMPQGSLSIEIALRAYRQDFFALPTIFALWGEHSSDLFQLLQWRNNLIVQKKTAHFFKDKVQEIGAAIEINKPHLIVISSSGTKGTFLYVDGEKKSFSSAIFLSDGEIFYNELVLGNAPTPQYTWQGEVYALSLHNRFFDENAVRERYIQWAKMKTLASLNDAYACYSFDERKGSVAHDRCGKMGDLTIPRIFQIPKKQILTMPWKDFVVNRSFAFDLMINFFGFMPFGGFCFAFLLGLPGLTDRRSFFITVISGAMISLFFELVQVFIPTRDSQMTDLISNIFGTVAGAWGAQWFLRRLIRSRREIRHELKG